MIDNHPYNLIFYFLTFLIFLKVRYSHILYPIHLQILKIGYLKTISKIIKASSRLYSIYFLQWVNNSVRYLPNKGYQLEYTFKGKRYLYPISPKQQIIQVIDQDDNDVSDEITKIMGPNEDFYGSTHSPNSLGYLTLIFNTIEDEIRFDGDQPIVIKKE